MKTASSRALAGLATPMLVASLLALAACASTPPPTDALNGAESAIKRAEEARVADYASPELKSAREKLTAAREAANREDMKLAARLAEQARSDAEVATAKAEAMKAKASITEIKKSNDALQQESQRNNSNTAPMVLPAPPAKPQPNGGY